MHAHRIAVFLIIFGFFAASPTQAKPWWMRGIESKDTDFLPPDSAFALSARQDGNLVRVRWVIADGYYLYKQKIELKPASPDLQLLAPQLPQGLVKTDPYLGTQEVYTRQVETSVPYTRIDAGAHPIEIQVTYQGCAEAGLCYPPITKVVFPSTGTPMRSVDVAPLAWQGIAIIAGVLGFFVAGLVLRKGRKLDVPA